MDTLCLQDDSSPVPVFNLQNQHASQGHTPIHTQRDFSDPTLTAVPAWDGSVTPKHEVPPPPPKKVPFYLVRTEATCVCFVEKQIQRVSENEKWSYTGARGRRGGSCLSR